MAKIDTKIDTKSDNAKSDNTKIDNAKIETRTETKIDLDAMSIEDLATLRDNANAKLLEKVAARQIELEAELDRLSQYGKPAKKAAAAAVTAPVAPKPKKNEMKSETKTEKKSEEPEAPVAEAA